MKSYLSLIAFSFFLASGCAQENTPAIETPTVVNYTYETLVGDINIPWGMAFIGENELLVTEISGTLYHVLNGVTRMNIIKLCKQNNISIKEKEIILSEAQKMDAMFLTGTSLNAIAVKKLNKFEFEGSALRLCDVAAAVESTGPGWSDMPTTPLVSSSSPLLFLFSFLAFFRSFNVLFFFIFIVFIIL